MRIHPQNLKDFVSLSLVMSCLTLTAWTFRENQRLLTSLPEPTRAAPTPLPPPVVTTYAPAFSLQLSLPPASSQPVTVPFHPSQLNPAEPWLGVVASRKTPGLLALWSANLVQRSEDNGATYQTVLAHDGDVQKVVFDDEGNLYVIRQDQLGVRTLKGKESWKKLPGQTLDLVAGARLAWLGNKEGREGEPGGGILAISTNKGSTWKTQESHDELPGLGTYHNQLYLSSADELFFMESSEASCGGGHQRRYQQLSDGTWEDLMWGIDTYGEFQIGAGGFAYGPSTCDNESMGLCAVGAATEARALSGVRVDAGQSWKIVTNDKKSFLFSDGTLYALNGAKDKVLERALPKDFSPQTVDAEGNLLGLLFGKVLRWSPKAGWTQLR